MPTGTPLWPKCPKCKRGKYGYLPIRSGTMRTGKIERRVTRSKHRGCGAGGASFNGHRGQMKCHDCGHAWFSTSPKSGRARCWSDEQCAAENHTARFMEE